MAGNVWEWTASGYSEDYSKNRANDKRVFRGGGWDYNYPPYLRGARRDSLMPSLSSNNIDFRCAR